MPVQSQNLIGQLKSLIKADGTTNPESAVLFMREQNALTVQKAFDGTTLRLIKTEDENGLFDTLNGLLYATNLALNVKEKLNEFQAFDIINMLMNDYADIKLDELIYLFKQGKKGIYGPHYNKFDIETIVNWINGYYRSDEYNNYLENRHKKPIEKVELTEEQRKGWSDIVKNFTTFAKEKKGEKAPIVNRVSVNVFHERFKTYAKGLSIEELNNLIKEYKKEAPDYVEIIKKELKTRTDEKTNS